MCSYNAGATNLGQPTALPHSSSWLRAIARMALSCSLLACGFNAAAWAQTLQCLFFTCKFASCVYGLRRNCTVIHRIPSPSLSHPQTRLPPLPFYTPQHPSNDSSLVASAPQTDETLALGRVGGTPSVTILPSGPRTHGHPNANAQFPLHLHSPPVSPLVDREYVGATATPFGSCK
jgi:hypothetical protein